MHADLCRQQRSSSFVTLDPRSLVLVGQLPDPSGEKGIPHKTRGERFLPCERQNPSWLKQDYSEKLFEVKECTYCDFFTL